MKTYRFSLLLTIILFFIWLFIYQAKDLPYDDNIGSILVSFLISLMTTLTIIWLFFKKRIIIKKNIILVIVFLITSSPIPLFYVVTNYEYLFGKGLDVG